MEEVWIIGVVLAAHYLVFLFALVLGFWFDCLVIRLFCLLVSPPMKSIILHIHIIYTVHFLNV